MFVITEEDIIAGLVLFDEVGFEDEGFGFCGGFDEVQRGGLADEAGKAGALLGFLEIAADAAGEDLGFTDVEDFVLFV